MLIQVCLNFFEFAFFLFVVNLFRPRATVEKTEATRKALEDFGGTLVLTEEELKQREDLNEFGPIKLALDCLGGKPALTLMKNLAPGGTLINYGGMTRQPIPTPVSALIFKGIKIRGFWLSSMWNQVDNLDKRLAMLNEISDWIIDGRLKLSPVELISHKDWKTAISGSLFKDDIPTNLPCKRVLSFPEAS